MSPAVLYPRFDHPAIEERYASWQSQMLLRAGGDIEFAVYDAEEPASFAAAGLESDHVLVVTDPLLLPPAKLVTRLRELLVHTSSVVAALPVSNEAENPIQRRAAAPYLTLRELQQVTSELQSRGADGEVVKWDGADPAAYLCRTEWLETIDDPPRHALAGREVVLSPADYVHRWSSLRGQTRTDLLARIAPDAKSILEFGCGEAPLGAALKQRQKCRVVGIEIDPRAAAIARKRIDDVYCGDAREIVALIKEKFDWIIGGDIVEHIDEPWSFLSDLRKVAAPGGHLLLSIPNIAHAAVVSDLLRGRFDYVYMGLTCVGHLRFFTKRTIEEMLSIAGWTVVEIAPQETVVTRGREELLAALAAARIPHSKEDLVPAGYYVVARNS
ncbi:MAG TPA: class I SAM-dependent methyltransferase [Thermoanaerobaculia bacterium]|jgi:SAM-dependent methyltransferase|nr:class I SAM-dependent methyltransferase [Thermoanaerobaculia bacterium]